MEKPEVISRLKHMFRSCKPYPECLHWRKDKGCDGCKEAVNIAIAALEQGDQSQYWEQQAKKRDAEASKMRITIKWKLDTVRADIVEIRHLLLTEDSALDQAILGWKAEQLERWARFLEDLLYTGGVEQKQVGEDWKQNTMERFGRVE